jgi:hypothetical protein
MTLAATLRDRLRDRFSGAAAAVAVQAGLLALLVLSFEAVRHAVEEKETILTLPPLIKPVARHAPVVIDARGKRRPAGVAQPEAPLPAYAQPSRNLSAPQGGIALQGPASGLDNCRVENGGTNAREGCLPAQGRPRPADAQLAPPAKVKHQPYWEAERAAAHTPPRVPCVSLFSVQVGMDGFQKKDSGVMTDPLCIIRELRGGADSGKPQYDSAPSDPGGGHASEVAFKQALAAVQTRQRALYGKAAPTSGAQAGAP